MNFNIWLPWWTVEFGGDSRPFRLLRLLATWVLNLSSMGSGVYKHVVTAGWGPCDTDLL